MICMSSIDTMMSYLAKFIDFGDWLDAIGTKVEDKKLLARG